MATNLAAHSPAAADAYDVLNDDLSVAIGLSEARVQRLLRTAFISSQTAENGILRLMNRKGIDHVAARIVDHQSVRHTMTFGGLRGMYAFWNRGAVRAALAELPDALRELKQLCDRQQDVQQAQRNLRTPSQTSLQRVLERSKGYGRDSGRIR